MTINRSGSADRLIQPRPASTTTTTTTTTPVGQPADFVTIHIEENKAGGAPVGDAQPGVFNRAWFGAQRCEYGMSCLKGTCSFVTAMAKFTSSSAAGALSLSQLALVLYATGNPEIAGAIATAGAVTGAAAHLTHQFKCTEHCSQFLMKVLGTAQRFQAVAGGSAPWAGRFAGMMQSYALTKAVEGSLGGIWGAAAHEGPYRAILTTGTLMGISDACGMVQVCNASIQELAAWAAYYGDTPLMLPDLAGSASNLPKGVTYGFATAAGAEAMISAQQLRPGLQALSQPPFNSLVFEPSTSAMFNSSAIGLLVAAISYHYSVDMEGSEWTDCSKKIDEAIDAVEKHFKNAAEASARKEKFGDKPLEELTNIERADLEEAQNEAVQAEKAARSCCATLGKTLEGIGKKLTAEYVRVVGSTMDMATVSPFRNCKNCLGESCIAQTIGLVCRALTTPAAAIGCYAATQMLLPSLDHSPAVQRSVMIAGYAEYTLFWLGTLFPWHEARTDPAMDQLRATERTWQSELFRAGLITVGTGALSLIADHLLDEAIDGRRSANDLSDVSGVVLMGAGLIGLGANLLPLFMGWAGVHRPSGIDTERAFDATMALAIGTAVGSLDPEQYGAFTAAAGVAVGQLVAVGERMRRIKREGGDKEGDDARISAANNNTKRAAAAAAKRQKAALKELATMTPAQQQQTLLDGMVQMAHAARISQHLDIANARAEIDRSIARLPEDEQEDARDDVQAFRGLFMQDFDYEQETKGGPAPVLSQIQIPTLRMRAPFSNGSSSSSSSTPFSSFSSSSSSSSTSSTTSSSAGLPHETKTNSPQAQPTVNLPVPDPLGMVVPPPSPSLTGQSPSLQNFFGPQNVTPTDTDIPLLISKLDTMRANNTSPDMLELEIGTMAQKLTTEEQQAFNQQLQEVGLPQIPQYTHYP